MKFLYLLIALLVFNNLSAQEEKIKSLEKELAKSKTQKDRFEIAYQLCFEWNKLNTEKGKELASIYLAEAKKAKDAYYQSKFLNILATSYLFLGDYQLSLKYFSEGLSIAHKTNNLEMAAKITGNMGLLYDNLGMYDSSLMSYKRSLGYFITLKDTHNIADCYMSIGTWHYYEENFDSSSIYLYKALMYFKSVNRVEGVADVYVNLSNNFFSKGELGRAMQFLNKADKIYDSLNIDYKLADAKYSIGVLFIEMDSTEKARDVLFQSLHIKKIRKDVLGIARSYYSIANTFEMEHSYDSAQRYYQHALNHYKSVNNDWGIASVTSSLGIMEMNKKNYSIAEDLLKQALRAHQKIGNGEGEANQMQNLANLYFTTKNYAQALNFAKSAYKLYKDIDYNLRLSENLKTLINVSEELSDFKNAFIYQKELIQLSDSLQNYENRKLLTEMETQFGTREKEAKNKLLMQEASLKDAALKISQEKDARKKTLLYLSGGVLIIVLASLVFVYRSNLAKKRANNLLAERNKEIIKQSAALKTQKEIIEEKQKEITDSINYAKRIQTSLLASEESMTQYFKDHFVLFQPKDIVSGDFYWSHHEKNSFHIMCADCTGHGVPGAFMSLLGVTYLNEIIQSDASVLPPTILNRLREKIIATLNPTGTEESRDGMDAVFCSFNKQENKMFAACANNPIWIMRKEKDETSCLEIKPDKMPIGLYSKMNPFTLQEIELKENDTIYCFTDGYPDQFGGPKNKKFKYSHLKEVLIGMNQLSLQAQKEKLEAILTDWKGEMEQTDDICIIGIRI